MQRWSGMLTPPFWDVIAYRLFLCLGQTERWAGRGTWVWFGVHVWLICTQLRLSADGLVDQNVQVEVFTVSQPRLRRMTQDGTHRAVILCCTVFLEGTYSKFSHNQTCAAVPIPPISSGPSPISMSFALDKSDWVSLGKVPLLEQ